MTTRPRPVLRHWTGLLDRAAVLAALVAATGLYLRAHARLGPVAAPALEQFRDSHRMPVPGFGWWSWWDQSAYVQAALAWAHGVLDPAYHWYLPGYPLLGAPFVHVTPGQPFMLPDLACLAGSLWLFAALAARLLGGVPYGRAVGAAVFLATSVLPERALWSWVVPWTTTPETPLLLACLLAAARFVERPGAACAFVAALAGVAVAAFRPADAAIVTAAAGTVMAWTLAERWPGWKGGARIAAAALAGAGLPVLLLGGAYAAVWGLAPSGYLLLSREFGFEWRLLPLRWVELMIDPMPVFPDGRGLAAAFPWIAPGIAGMAACMAAPPGTTPRRLHAAVIAAVLLDCAAYLAYRDLHPTGLWRYGNFHYFKWTLPVFGLYAVLLLRVLASPRRLPGLAAAAAAVLLLFAWRVELVDPVPLPLPTGPTDLVAPAGLPGIGAALLAKASGDPAALYNEGSTLDAGERRFRSFFDFKPYLQADRLMVLPLRPLPGAPATLHLVPGTVLDPATPPILARQALVWGLPCWVARGRPACQPFFPFPPVPLDPGRVLDLGAAAEGSGVEGVLVTGWSVPAPDGRWTDGPRATLRFGLPPIPPGEVAVVELTASGYPFRAAPTRVTAVANGRKVATWRFAPGPPAMARAAIPGDVTGPGGAVTLDLLVANPRQPWRDDDLPDARELGIQVRSVRVTTAPDPQGAAR